MIICFCYESLREVICRRSFVLRIPTIYFVLYFITHRTSIDGTQPSLNWKKYTSKGKSENYFFILNLFYGGITPSVQWLQSDYFYSGHLYCYKKC